MAFMTNPFIEWLKIGKIRIENGNIIIFNATNILFPTRSWLKFCKLLEEELGKEKAEEFQRKVGEFQIAQALHRYKKLFNIEKIEKEKFFEMGAYIAEVLGLGIWKISKNKTIIENNPISSEYKLMFGKSSKPIDHYLAGMIKNVYQSYSGKPVVVKETKCIACGDPYCQFEVFPTPKKPKT